MKTITIQVEDQDLLNFESAACGDTGRDAAIAALTASYDPNTSPYPTLQEAIDAMVADRLAGVSGRIFLLMSRFSADHADRMHDAYLAAQEVQARENFRAMLEQRIEAASETTLITIS